MNTGMYVSFSISMPVVLEVVVVGPSADVGIVDVQGVEEQLDSLTSKSRAMLKSRW